MAHPRISEEDDAGSVKWGHALDKDVESLDESDFDKTIKTWDLGKSLGLRQMKRILTSGAAPLYLKGAVASPKNFSFL